MVDSSKSLTCNYSRALHVHVYKKRGATKRMIMHLIWDKRSPTVVAEHTWPWYPGFSLLKEGIPAAAKALL